MTPTPRSLPELGPPVHDRTRRNLIAAMQAEALAYATYVLYAAHARRHGSEALARLFEEAAQEDLYSHFARQAELIDLVGDDVDNLLAAIECERYEVKSRYVEYAAAATAAGDDVAAALFESVRDDERRHERGFRRALAEAAGQAVPQR
jgi:rubrerythrin